jgi:NAD(P)-dependent dehydrogenase (short-subunit alcohol dehydrogenase family)
MKMSTSYVVTGGGRGVGRAITERLAEADGAVVVIELDETALGWLPGHPAAGRLAGVTGSAAEEAVAEAAADAAQARGRLGGWVNNAAIFRDAALHSAGPGQVMELIAANLAPAVTGTAVAVRRLLADGGGGAIVNVSSHRAQRAVRGALPYATAKAAIEGLTRAAAVDYGPDDIRVNAVALGSIDTDRYRSLLTGQEPQAAAGIEAQMARLHPLGRVGGTAEVTDTVAYLLSERASFISGVVLPVDGGRAAQARTGGRLAVRRVRGAGGGWGPRGFRGGRGRRALRRLRGRRLARGAEDALGLADQPVGPVPEHLEPPHGLFDPFLEPLGRVGSAVMMLALDVEDPRGQFLVVRVHHLLGLVGQFFRLVGGFLGRVGLPFGLLGAAAGLIGGLPGLAGALPGLGPVLGFGPVAGQVGDLLGHVGGLFRHVGGLVGVLGSFPGSFGSFAGLVGQAVGLVGALLGQPGVPLAVAFLALVLGVHLGALLAVVLGVLRGVFLAVLFAGRVLVADHVPGHAVGLAGLGHAVADGGLTGLVLSHDHFLSWRDGPRQPATVNWP